MKFVNIAKRFVISKPGHTIVLEVATASSSRGPGLVLHHLRRACKEVPTVLRLGGKETW